MRYKGLVYRIDGFHAPMGITEAEKGVWIIRGRCSIAETIKHKIVQEEYHILRRCLNTALVVSTREAKWEYTSVHLTMDGIRFREVLHVHLTPEASTEGKYKYNCNPELAVIDKGVLKRLLRDEGLRLKRVRNFRML